MLISVEIFLFILTIPLDSTRCAYIITLMIKSNKIREARLRAGLTQTQAGKLVHAPLRTWQDWEYGKRPMNAANWELFNIKLKQLEK